ncbi:TetR/AcrR family transcriptional regulator [Eubacterium pyruvativorans]|uniref:TetR/AcrR family transcriptional regulator n=1 Tax=Eubacterium pyruvativorans TaxID=155865 RepID=UPI001568072B|nr:TetR family transcriptional regulator [Eubacterium pyruvativorans]
MPRGSSDLTNRRKEEIVDACEKLYREKGFHDITIKDISQETSMSRPSILQTAVLRREAVSFHSVSKA